MKLAHLLSLPVLAMLAGCSPKAGAAGSYTIDAVATRMAMDTKVKDATLPAEQKTALEAAHKRLNEDKGLHGDYTLKADGTYTAHLGFDGGHQDVSGTWKQDGSTVTLTQTHVEGQPKPATSTGTVSGNEIHLKLDNGITLVLRKK